MMNKSLLSLVRRAFSATGNAQKTFLYDIHNEYGGKMVDFAGYLLPEQYANYGVKKEHMAVRAANSCGLFDVSHMGQLRWYGKDRVEFLETILVADVASIKPGHSMLSLIMNKDGGIVDDTVLTNSTDYFYQVVNGSTKLTDMEYFDSLLADFRRKGKDVHYEYLQDRALIAIQGKGAHDLVQPFISIDLSKLSFMNSTKSKVRGFNNVRISRCGYTGEDGFELSIKEHDAIPLTKQLIQAGAIPCGLGCRDSLRLEAGLCLYGNEMDSTVDPISASLLWTISKSRRTNGTFLGFNHVMGMKDNWVHKRVGFVSKGAPARHGAKIYSKSGDEIGYVTSGTFSPVLNHPIAMGYINRGYHTENTEVLFDIRGKKYEGKVSKMPFVPTTYYRAP